MATYYVRKGGNDANTGLSNALAGGGGATGAFLTIGKLLGASGMASGDTAYIGAGIYREAILLGFTPAATTFIIGDVDGSKTGDAGEVRWTAYTTDDKTVANTNATCRLNGKSFLSFSNIHFVGGNGSTGSCVDGNSVTGSHDLTFTRCAFTSGSNGGALSVRFTGPVDVAFNYTVDSCWFGPTGIGAQMDVLVPTSTTADYDTAIVVKNCVFLGCPNDGGFSMQGTGANTFRGGGCTFINNSVYSGLIRALAGVSEVYPLKVSNCYLQSADTGAVSIQAAVAGQMVEDYNLMNILTARQLMSTGPYSVLSFSYSQLQSYGQEGVWGGQARPFGTPGSNSPALGFGNAALAVGRGPTVTDDATTGTIAWVNLGTGVSVNRVARARWMPVWQPTS